MPKKTFPFLLSIMALMVVVACKQSITPKPRGFFRVDFPDKAYRVYDTNCPFLFEYPLYAVIEREDDRTGEPCWFNISFPELDAKIHISYKKISGDFGPLLEDTYALAYKHATKADAIEDLLIIRPEDNVFGILYLIKGNVASSRQFFLTDSTTNYLRGALYFNVTPDKDSLAPVIDFIGKDIEHLINTLKWK